MGKNLVWKGIERPENMKFEMKSKHALLVRNLDKKIYKMPQLMLQVWIRRANIAAMDTL
jgi:hypothetical protein